MRLETNHRRGIHQTGVLRLSEFIYADDALMLGVAEEYIRDLMESIRETGPYHGLSFNRGKLEEMPVRCQT